GSALAWHARPEAGFAGRNVLLIDDIFDEGKTLAAVSGYFTAQGAHRVVTAVLLDKAHARKVEGFTPDVVGLSCPDEYVFGFGMDYEGKLRNLAEIRSLV
ncbi:MAG: hypoxanthine-guanine phosphoribosyltransferase, partial [Pseudomonadales bacterium]|nr:hypoxanthine-guanine phosphoribosyltransferase [Pseudomonadales bacterium]